MNILNFFSHLSITKILLCALAFLAGLGVVDYYTPEVASAIFYLMPVVFTAWFAGKKPAFFISLLCSAVGFAANERWAHVNWAVLWNTAVDLSIFLSASYLVSALKSALDHEKEMARTDFLTSLNNSRSFYELLEGELDRARRYGRNFSVVYFDVDNFKQVNDRFGHNAGDELLCKSAIAITESIRTSDIAGRLGGDEFAIFLPETDFEQTEAVVKRLRSSLIAVAKANHWPVSFSLGVATFERKYDSPDEIIGIADNLMYSVKEQGKNNVKHELFK